MQCLQCHITWVIFIFYWTVRQSLDNCYNLTLFSNLRFLLEARVYLSIHSSEMPLFSYSFDSEFREQKNSEDISVCETWMLGFFYYKTSLFLDILYSIFSLCFTNATFLYVPSCPYTEILIHFFLHCFLLHLLIKWQFCVHWNIIIILSV